MAESVELKVAMSCQGCAGAVKRVLDKMEGVESYDIDLEQQKVTVKGNVQPEAVLNTVSKTGKKTTFWEAAAPLETEAKAAEVETEVKAAEVETPKAAEVETEAKAAEVQTATPVIAQTAIPVEVATMVTGVAGLP